MSESKTAPLTIKDYLVSGETFKVSQHPQYDILETLPQPSAENLGSYYESEDYISHTDSNKGFMARLYQLVKMYSLSKKVRLITSLNQGTGSLLDIGAGTGDFLKTAQSVAWECYGAEVSEKARAIAKEKNVELLEDFNHFKGQQFDVVTLWHVLEHLPNLEETLQTIASFVKPGGHLIIAVPNYKSYDATYYKEFWAAYDVPRHLWHFSKKGIRQVISSSFQLTKTLPMIFDSFYVSLLSQKHKTGNSFSIKALWIGFRSNFKAISTKEYSSQIYCFKKDK